MATGTSSYIRRTFVREDSVYLVFCPLDFLSFPSSQCDTSSELKDNNVVFIYHTIIVFFDLGLQCISNSIHLINPMPTDLHTNQLNQLAIETKGMSAQFE